MASGLKEVGKTTPVAEVIRRVLEGKGKPVTVEELTVHVLDSWGRDFPGTPNEDVCLVYKLATCVLGCQETYDEVGGQAPVVTASDRHVEPLALNPRMSAENLNRIADKVRHVKLSLPPAAGSAPPPAEEKPATARKKK